MRAHFGPQQHRALTLPSTVSNIFQLQLHLLYDLNRTNISCTNMSARTQVLASLSTLPLYFNTRLTALLLQPHGLHSSSLLVPSLSAYYCWHKTSVEEASSAMLGTSRSCAVSLISRPPTRLALREALQGCSPVASTGLHLRSFTMTAISASSRAVLRCRTWPTL